MKWIGVGVGLEVKWSWSGIEVEWNGVLLPHCTHHHIVMELKWDEIDWSWSGVEVDWNWIGVGIGQERSSTPPSPETEGNRESLQVS